MINYVIQCFTTPHYLMTEAQEIVGAAVILPVVLLFVGITTLIVLRYFE